MPNSLASGRRRSNRIVRKKQASLIANTRGPAERFPCLVIVRSEHGLRLRGGFRLKRRRVVELDFLTLRCRIKRVDIGEAGRETV